MAKVNTGVKGAIIERKVIQLLEDQGYYIHRAVRTGHKRGNFYVSQNNDVFGCIDIIAKKPGERTRWIQVTAHSGIGQKKKDLEEVPWDQNYDSVEIWRWIGSKHGKRHAKTGELLPDLYFQLYLRDQNYILSEENRVNMRDNQ